MDDCNLLRKSSVERSEIHDALKDYGTGKVQAMGPPAHLKATQNTDPLIGCGFPSLLRNIEKPFHDVVLGPTVPVAVPNFPLMRPPDTDRPWTVVAQSLPFTVNEMRLPLTWPDICQRRVQVPKGVPHSYGGTLVSVAPVH